MALLLRKASESNWIAADFAPSNQPSSSTATTTSRRGGGKRRRVEAARRTSPGRCASSPSPALAEPWVERHAPHSLAELAVHARKAAELRDWLLAHGGRPALLLATGPSGCGKTAAVRVVAAELGWPIREWRNTEQPLLLSERGADDAKLGVEDQTSAFLAFLMQTDYAALFGAAAADQASRQVVLLEDVPNLFFKSPSVLQDALRQYGSHGRHPLVMVLSDVSTQTDLSHRRLLSPAAMTELAIDTIVFNRVNATLMRKALQRVVKAEAPGTNSQASKLLVENCMELAAGDIRLAINQLQLLLNDRDSPPLETSSSSACVKDALLDRFHALGKFLYAKRREPTEEDDRSTVALPPHLAEHVRTQPLDFDPEAVLASCDVRAERIMLTLHENYAEFVVDCEQAALVLDDWSLLDALGKDWLAVRSAFDSFAGSAAARSLAHYRQRPSNAPPRKKTFLPIRGPAWPPVSQAADECRRQMDHCFPHSRMAYSTTTLAVELLPYSSSIGLQWTSTQHECVDRLADFGGAASSFVDCHRGKRAEKLSSADLPRQASPSRYDNEVDIDEI